MLKDYRRCGLMSELFKAVQHRCQELELPVQGIIGIPYYVRAPDPAAFIHQNAPALERRIDRSPLAGLTRSLVLDFYIGGLRLDVENGRLVTAANLSPGIEKPDGRFPPLVFLQLLFGYRSLSQICHSFPDASADPRNRSHLEHTFPMQALLGGGTVLRTML